MPSPETQELTTGAGRYANRRMYQCATRLLFLHLLFIYLQGDSLQTKQVIKSSFPFSPSRLSPSLSFLYIWIARRRGEQAKAWWIHSLSRSHKPCKCRSLTIARPQIWYVFCQQTPFNPFCCQPPLKSISTNAGRVKSAGERQTRHQHA